MNKIPLRTEFKGLPHKIDWFPGHMRKALRSLDGEMKTCDVFIEVRDSRIPKTSQNDQLLELIPPKMKRLVVYNKHDLVPQRKAQAMIKELHNDSKVPYMHLSTKENVNINKLL